MLLKVILSLYGLFLLSGAYFGMKAGSKVSLIMGIVSGVVVFAGIYFAGINPKAGYMFLTGTTVLLTIVFLMRVLKTHSFMPSGMLLLVTVVMLVVCALQLIKK